jgi:hypothetical protein
MRKIDLPLVQRIALTMAIAIMVACSWLAPIESAANNQIDAGFKRALISFATARLLNAGLSFVETTEISATPMGVGVKFAPGQVLKPMNDMVEQFAHLMLIASVAFGVEKMLISFGSYWLVSLFLTATAIGWAYLNYKKQHSPAWLSRILVVLLMIRFAIPIAVIGSDALFTHFMSDEYNASQKFLDTASSSLSDLSSQEAMPTTAPTDRPGVLDKAKGFFTQPPADSATKEESSVGDKIKSWFSRNGDLASKKIENLKQATSLWIEKIIKLIVIFLLQTLLLPIFFVWTLWGVARGAFEIPPSRFGFQNHRESEMPPAR